MRRCLALSVCLASGAACAVAGGGSDRAEVAAALVQRTGSGIAAEAAASTTAELPPDVDPAAIGEGEAIAIALWNNADLQAALTELGLRRAQLADAGLLRNPMFSLLFPLGPKQLEFALTWPLEALWQRPERVAAARLESQRTAHSLVQAGLDLVRDVRIACTDLALAHARADLAAAGADVERRVDEFLGRQLRLGEIGPLPAERAHLVVLDAQREVERLRAEVTLADVRLRALLGFALDARPLAFALSLSDAIETPPDERPLADDEALLRTALATRPDVRAAELALEAAGERAGLAEHQWLSLAAILDANGSGDRGFEAGPGLLLDVPLFDRGQGRRAIADAELEAAARRYQALRQTIAAEIAQARRRLGQTAEDRAQYRTVLLPALRAARDRAARAQALGELTVLPVLEAERALVAARSRAAEAVAEHRRALARLERGVGRRLDRETQR